MLSRLESPSLPSPSAAAATAAAAVCNCRSPTHLSCHRQSRRAKTRAGMRSLAASRLATSVLPPGDQRWTCVSWLVLRLYSVPARHISEGAAPHPTVLRPARLYSALPAFKKNVIAVFVFLDGGVKMLVKCLQICVHVFIDRPQNCAQTSFRSRAGLRPNFGHSRSKLCPIMCRSRTKLCPDFGCSRSACYVLL